MVKDKLTDLWGTSPLLQERGTFTALISLNVLVEMGSESQPPHKTVNLLFELVMVNNTSTIL